MALALLAMHTQNLAYGFVDELFVVHASISSSLLFLAVCGRSIVRWADFLGRNTLPIYLFSPIFTFACKPLVPWCAFDPAGLMFLCLSLAVCVAGSVGIARLLDATRLPAAVLGKPLFTP